MAGFFNRGGGAAANPNPNPNPGSECSDIHQTIVDQLCGDDRDGADMAVGAALSETKAVARLWLAATGADKAVNMDKFCPQ